MYELESHDSLFRRCLHLSRTMGFAEDARLTLSLLPNLKVRHVIHKIFCSYVLGGLIIQFTWSLLSHIDKVHKHRRVDGIFSKTPTNLRLFGVLMTLQAFEAGTVAIYEKKHELCTVHFEDRGQLEYAQFYNLNNMILDIAYCWTIHDVLSL